MSSKNRGNFSAGFIFFAFVLSFVATATKCSNDRLEKKLENGKPAQTQPATQPTTTPTRRNVITNCSDGFTNVDDLDPPKPIKRALDPRNHV